MEIINLAQARVRFIPAKFFPFNFFLICKISIKPINRFLTLNKLASSTWNYLESYRIGNLRKKNVQITNVFIYGYSSLTHIGRILITIHLLPTFSIHTIEIDCSHFFVPLIKMRYFRHLSLLFFFLFFSIIIFVERVSHPIDTDGR